MSPSIYKKICLILLLQVSFSVPAQEKGKEKAIDIPLYQGVQLGFDLASPAGLLISDSWGAGIKADVNLKNKYFPTFEVGFANFDKTSDTGIHFKSSGQYFKIGVNKALSYHGDKAEDLFFAGAHYGFSAFSYDLDHLVYNQNYWGNNVTSLQNEKAVTGWIELVAGVRVKVLGPISLGWTAQYKSTLHVSNGNNSAPAYIPGFGLNLKPNVTMAFHLYYRLPL